MDQPTWRRASNTTQRDETTAPASDNQTDQSHGHDGPLSTPDPFRPEAHPPARESEAEQHAHRSTNREHEGSSYRQAPREPRWQHDRYDQTDRDRGSGGGVDRWRQPERDGGARFRGQGYHDQHSTNSGYNNDYHSGYNNNYNNRYNNNNYSNNNYNNNNYNSGSSYNNRYQDRPRYRSIGVQWGQPGEVYRDPPPAPLKEVEFADDIWKDLPVPKDDDEAAPGPETKKDDSTKAAVDSDAQGQPSQEPAQSTESADPVRKLETGLESVTVSEKKRAQRPCIPVRD